MVRQNFGRVNLTRLCATFLWLFVCFDDLYAVKIVKVVVPDIIQYGVQDDVILDCDFSYGNNTSGLVIKWFFKNKSRPVYQWIVHQKPQDLGILRGRVDLSYKASNDPLKMHRALRIVKLNTDISGEYTCVVSTFMEEDSKTKQMTVFDLYAVKIVKVVVPDIIQYGVQDDVILDCDFSYGNNTSGLVIKWFFKNKSRPVYQWIVHQKPQDLGILRGRVDLSYKASNDPLKMHRALRIVKLNTDISGEYTCVVSTFMEEDSKTKQMTVFVPESNFRLVQNKSDDDTVNVICVAEGAYPAPNLTLATPERRLDNVSHHSKMINGRFLVVASATLRDVDLPTPAEFICTLRIPQAKYAVRKEAIYYPGPMSTTPEMPTAADMQLAAAVGSIGVNYHTASIPTILLLSFAQMVST